MESMAQSFVLAKVKNEGYVLRKTITICDILTKPNTDNQYLKFELIYQL